MRGWNKWWDKRGEGVGDMERANIHLDSDFKAVQLWQRTVSGGSYVIWPIYVIAKYENAKEY